jgi:hypothetical protein
MFQLQRVVVVYNINLNSFKNIFNLNDKQTDLYRCLLKVHDFLEHLMTFSTNSTKFSGAGAIPNWV